MIFILFISLLRFALAEDVCPYTIYTPSGSPFHVGQAVQVGWNVDTWSVENCTLPPMLIRLMDGRISVENAFKAAELVTVDPLASIETTVVIPNVPDGSSYFLQMGDDTDGLYMYTAVFEIQGYVNTSTIVTTTTIEDFSSTMTQQATTITEQVTMTTSVEATAGDTLTPRATATIESKGFKTIGLLGIMACFI